MEGAGSVSVPEVPVTVMGQVPGCAPCCWSPPPPSPPLLAPPPQDGSKSASRNNPSIEAGSVSLACFLRRPLVPNGASAGSAAIRRKRKRHDLAYYRPAYTERGSPHFGVVEIVITTAVALLPGATVTGFGLKLHSAEITGVLEQDKVTALANEAPTGSRLKL